MRTLIRYPFLAAFAFLLSVFLLPAAQAQTSDLSVSKTGPNGATANSDVTYTIEVTNFGPDDSDTATLYDPLPAGTTFVSMTQNSGPTWSCTNPGAAPGTFINNTATVSTATDPNDENNSGTATTVVSGNTADLGVTKSVDSDQAVANSDVTYTITVTNNGPNSANNAAWNDVLPAPGNTTPAMTFVSLTQNSGPVWTCTNPGSGNNGTVSCTNGSVPVNSTSVFTLVGHIPSGTSPGASYTNTGTVTSSADTNPDNDSSDVTTTVVNAAPTLTTQASSATTTVGNPIFDRATLSGGFNATGTISFFVYGPDDATCAGGATFNSNVTV